MHQRYRVGPCLGDRQAHRGFPFPAVLHPLEEVIAKADTGLSRILAIVGRPLAVAMRVKPLVPGTGTAKDLERAPRMQQVV